MAPLDPRYLTRISGGRPVTHHEHCRKCRYDLIGLRTGQRCPECGAPIDFDTAMREDGAHYGPEVIYRDPGPFLAAPRRYLGWLAASLVALGLAGPAMAGALAALVFWPRPVVAMAAAACAAVWGAACWAVAAPRRVAIATSIDGESESRGLRIGVRWTQWVWMGVGATAVLLTLPGVVPGPASPPPGVRLVVLLLGGMAGVVAGVGAAAVFVHLSNLMFWAGDTALASRLRECAWVLAPAAVIGGPAWATGLSGALARGALNLEHWGAVLVAGAGVAAALAMLYPAACVLRLYGKGRWISGELRDSAGRPPMVRGPLPPGVGRG